MIYITGDCHADFRKFNTENFPEQKTMNSKEDYVIICGDFGIWHDTPEERHWLDWLNKKNFTTLFVDGNHENFDRLYGNEFPMKTLKGGLTHQIRENIYHLMRGQIFQINGKKFFAFGGAQSHDIQDGIINPEEYESFSDAIREYNRLTRQGKMLRINHTSWWKEEMPSEEEMDFGLNNLKNAKNKVDYIISHCCPQHIASVMSNGFYEPDELTLYFNKVDRNVDFTRWYFGHYHCNNTFMNRYTVLYNDIVRVC